MNPPYFFTEKERAAFSIVDALKAAAAGDLHGSLHAEMLQESTIRAGKPFHHDGHAFHLPFELMRRDLTAASASGGMIVATESPFALDVLRPFTATLRSGAQMMRFQGNATVPKVSAPSSATWVATEGVTAVSESQAVIGQVSLTPKNAAILVEVSAQLTRQTDIGRFLQRELLRSTGSALDAAIFNGSGTNGQPQGIIGSTGVNTTSGTSLGWTGVTDLLYGVAEADGQEGVAWFGTPAVRRLLSRRERVAGGGRSIWDDTEIAGFPAYSSHVAPTGSLIVGAFNEVMVGLFQDGIDIQVHPTDFSRGLLAFRSWLSCDVAVTNPAAFGVAVSIT